ncbi:ankyrin repeat-containing domain protein [Mycena rebaudengoi]|nr:ankyrin repeat-containing domain protein [Mycena rebaudengoi]
MPASQVVKNKLENWLQPANMSDKQHETQKLHHEGTGIWFLDGHQLTEWIAKPGSLWIEGNSGTGKSVISSTVIRKLIHDRPPSDHGTAAVGYFYFDFRDDKKQLVDTMLRSVVFQLSGQSLNPYAALNSQYEKLSRGQTLPTTQDLLDILDQLLLEFQHTYVVLDALDECRGMDLQALVQLLSNLRLRTEGSLHLLFTSQPREIFTAGLKGVQRVIMESKTTQKDIEQFVSSEVRSRLRDLKHWSRWKSHADEITAKVVEKSNGMFRLAACLLIEMSRPKLEPNLHMILANLPNELYGIYERFMETIDKDDCIYVERVLRWLLFSAKPMSLPQLEETLAFDFSDPHLAVYDPSKRGENATIICGFLEGLVIVGEDVTGPTDRRTMSVVVSLAHASVADYLASDKFATKGRCNLNREHAHTLLAQTCVGYLLHFENHPCHFEQQNHSYCWNLTKQTSLEYPLAEYAAQYWSHHLLRCHDRAALLTSTARLFVSGSRQYETLNNLYNINSLGSRSSCFPQPLYICSLIGYREGVEYLLRSGADANAVGGGFQNALQAASAKGHIDIICALLENGADINKAGGDCGSALQVAAVGGHTGVVSILCEKGAHVNAAGGFHGSALQAAAARGHTEVVGILCEKGADVNTADVVRGSALQAAAAGGHAEIVGILCEKGADVNTADGIHGSALQAAAAGGHTEVVDILCEKGADVNTVGGHYGSALQAASLMGAKEIVQILIEKGADVNVTGGSYGSALQVAAKGGHTEVVGILCEKGADVNTAGGIYGSALQAAAAHGHTKVVGILIEKGAEVNTVGGYYGSALQAASKRGHLEIIQILIGKGADVNTVGGEYGSALELASRNGCREIVQILRENGAIDRDQWDLQQFFV